MAVDPITQFELNRLRANNFQRKSFKMKSAGVIANAPGNANAPGSAPIRTIRILYGLYNTPEAKVFEATIQDGSLIRSAQVGATIQGANNPRPGVDNNGTYAIDSSMGYSVSLSKDGNIAAISAPESYDSAYRFGYQIGNVKVYEYDGTSWSQKGSTLYGGETADEVLVGTSVDLSDDGLKLLVQSSGPNTLDDGYSQAQSSYYVYEAGDWVLKSRPSFLFRYGYWAQMSNDGKVIMVTNPSEAWPSPGPKAFIFEYDSVNDSWSQRDSIALGLKAGGNFDINNDGSIICVTVSKTLNSTMVKVFKWNGASYDLMGTELGNLPYGTKNTLCRLNDAGDIIVIGGNDRSSSIFSNHIYRGNGVSWVEDSISVIPGSFEINHTGDIIVGYDWKIFEYTNSNWTLVGQIDTGGEGPGRVRANDSSIGYPSLGGRFAVGFSEI